VRRYITILAILIFLIPCLAQGMEGVFQLELESWNGTVVSKATGFLLKSPYSKKSYLVSSFHLLNAHLIDAKGIKLIDNYGARKSLDIVYYDELNDIMLLNAEDLLDEGFSLALGSDCDSEQSVLAYNQGILISKNFVGYEDTEIKGAYRIPIYLRSGFSGAPVVNAEANLCSMVVLSSERNASSVVISGELIARALKVADDSINTYSVSMIRQAMGLEKIIKNQEELDRVIRSKGAGYLIVNIDPEILGSEFRIKESQNLVVTGGSGIGNLIIHRSRNIMLRELNPNRIVLNESSGLTVTACIFNKKDKAMYIRNSLDYNIYGNLFKNIDTGIVLKEDNIEHKKSNSFEKNYFENVTNRLSYI
jgi:hypothetical protein